LRLFNRIIQSGKIECRILRIGKIENLRIFSNGSVAGSDGNIQCIAPSGIKPVVELFAEVAQAETIAAQIETGREAASVYNLLCGNRKQVGPVVVPENLDVIKAVSRLYKSKARLVPNGRPKT